MKQFEMYLANEYCEEIFDDLSKKMSITYDKQILKASISEMDEASIKNLFVAGRDDNKIIVDCNNRDFIYPLIVICDDAISTDIQSMMLEWDNRIREEYAQELTETMPDVYGNSNTLLNSIQEFYGLKNIGFSE